MTDLPEHYFRVRESGAAVFRVDTANRQQRIEMEQIATINLRNGEIRPQGDRVLSETDQRAIRDWIAARAEIAARREVDDILRTIDHLNQTAHWAHGRASAAQLEAVTDSLLLAMHDLRSVLVRKKADRLAKDAPQA